MKTHPNAAKVVLMGFDVDGVLTDGSLYFTEHGDQMKVFSSLDGHGIRMLMSAGIEVAFITARDSAMVAQRAQNLGVTELHQGVKDKWECLQEICHRKGLSFSQVGFVGDDLIDLPILSTCGFSASVANGDDFVKQHVDYVAQKSGGFGAVREICDLVLASQDKLEAMQQAYLRKRGS